MEDPYGAISLIVSGIWGCFSFCLTLAETALMSLPRERVEEWRGQGKHYAEVLDRLLQNRKKLLSFFDFLQILLAGLFFYFLFSAGFSLELHAGRGIAAFTLACGFLFYIFFGLFFPRKLAREHVEKISRLSAPCMAQLFQFAGWTGQLLDEASELLARLFGKEPTSSQTALSDEEIKMMVRLGKEEPLEIEKEEKEMIESVVTFGQTLVKEIMTPRIDMVCVDSSKSISEVLDVAMAHGYSKFPVYDGTIDNIVGIAYLKDLFRLVRSGQQGVPLKDIVRKPFFVPESKKVDDLLRDMQKEKISLAIVVDEYGGTDGLVTMEDLVEEIVGEITDEHDKLTPTILPLAERSWLVDGRLNIEDINSLLNLNLPSEEFETLGGYVYGLMGKVPKAGEKVETENVILEVVEIHRQRISKVKITAKTPVKAQETKEV